MRLTKEELETNFNIMGDDHKIVHVASNDPYWKKRLDAVAKPYEVSGTGKYQTRFYKLDLSKIAFSVGKKRKGKKLSEEQKRKMQEGRKGRKHFLKSCTN